MVGFKSAVGAGILFLGLTGMLATLCRLPVGRLPQGRTGEDVLSVLLGDAKKDISDSMVRTADSYFHGGVDIDCHLEGHDHEAHACDGHGDCPHHDHDHHGGETEPVPDHNHQFDPWRWINGQIRAPEVDRHLGQDKAKEMLPWFWMAVRSNPHNTEAWTTVWFAAASLMKDPNLARKVAEEAYRDNPDSLDVLCVLGRTYRLEGVRDDDKAIAAFSELRGKGAQKCKGDLDKLSDSDKASFLQALDYLSVYAADRGDLGCLKSLLDEARRTESRHAVVDNIAQRLKRLTP